VSLATVKSYENDMVKNVFNLSSLFKLITLVEDALLIMFHTKINISVAYAHSLHFFHLDAIRIVVF